MLRSDTLSDGKEESMFSISSLEEGPVLVGGAEGGFRLGGQIGVSTAWKGLRSLRALRRLSTNVARKMGSRRRGLVAFHACCFLSFRRMHVARGPEKPLIGLIYLLAASIELVNASLIFASIPVIKQEP